MLSWRIPKQCLGIDELVEVTNSQTLFGNRLPCNRAIPILYIPPFPHLVSFPLSSTSSPIECSPFSLPHCDYYDNMASHYHHHGLSDPTLKIHQALSHPHCDPSDSHEALLEACLSPIDKYSYPECRPRFAQEPSLKAY